MCLGEHVLKAYSKQQKVVALSSAEAELYAMVAASAETLAIQSYASDLGMELENDLYTDSAAALGIAARAGIGKVRHLRTQGLWVQEVKANGRIKFMKILGEKNPADLLTKHMSAELMKRHMATLNVKVTAGRAETAPGIDEFDEDEGEGSRESWMQTDDSQTGEWNRRFMMKRVEFSEVVEIRPIPATGAMRPCNKRSRIKALSKWQGNRQTTTRSPTTNARGSQEDIDTVPRDTEDKADDDTRRQHTCGMQGAGRWSEAEDDDSDDVECPACRVMYDELRRHRPDIAINSVEFGESDTLIDREKNTRIAEEYRGRAWGSQGCEDTHEGNIDYVPIIPSDARGARRADWRADVLGSLGACGGVACEGLRESERGVAGGRYSVEGGIEVARARPAIGWHAQIGSPSVLGGVGGNHTNRACVQQFLDQYLFFCRYRHAITACSFVNSFISNFCLSSVIIDAGRSSDAKTSLHDAASSESAHGDVQAPKEERLGLGICSVLVHVLMRRCIGVSGNRLEWNRFTDRLIPAGLKCSCTAKFVVRLTRAYLHIYPLRIPSGQAW